jgi:pyrimidine-nucleoside phosphorylase
MIPQWIIEKKRDGGVLSDSEIREFVDAFTEGTVPDYQMSALAMAIYFKGMTIAETAALTLAMLESGTRLDTTPLGRPTADKHSTGGIGDKISLILAPLVAACGVAVPMISGRGLGITGGTLDKLEAIPGYRTDLTEKAFLKVVNTCGCSIIGQTRRLAPADRKLYALRDVTGTVPSIPLITASILSKKLAEDLDALVLDVKCGRGAFMKTPAMARNLAKTLVQVATALGTRTAAVISAMDLPTGCAVGNAPEVAEAIAALQGQASADVEDLTLTLGCRMLLLTRVCRTPAEARTRLCDAWKSGRGLDIFRKMIELQQGNSRVIDRPELLFKGAQRQVVKAPRAGFVTAINSEDIGRACLILGAGRQRTTDRVDPTAGVADLKQVGTSVSRGEPLAVLVSRSSHAFPEAVQFIGRAFELQDRPPARPAKLILGACV